MDRCHRQFYMEVDQSCELLVRPWLNKIQPVDMVGENFMGKLKSYQEQVQETLDKALKSAEEQHRTLAAKPFDLAEKLEADAKELSVKSIRDAHDKALDGMYSALNSWNSRVSELSAELVAKFDKDQQAASKAEKRKAPARKASKPKAAAKKKVEEAVA